MSEGFLNIPWVVWGIISLIIAVIFVIFVPNSEQIQTTTGVHFFILRWFHSLCWILIAINFFLRIIDNETVTGIANMSGAAGGIVYLIFLVNYIQISGG